MQIFSRDNTQHYCINECIHWKNGCMFLHHTCYLNWCFYSACRHVSALDFIGFAYGHMWNARKSNETFFFFCNWPPFFLVDSQFTARAQKSWASPLTRDKPPGNEQMRKWGLQERCMNVTPCRREQIAGCKMPSWHGGQVHEGHLHMERTATAERILVQKWVQPKVGESLLKSKEAQRNPEGWRNWTNWKLRSFIPLKWTTKCQIT